MTDENMAYSGGSRRAADHECPPETPDAVTYCRVRNIRGMAGGVSAEIDDGDSISAVPIPGSTGLVDFAARLREGDKIAIHRCRDGLLRGIETADGREAWHGGRGRDGAAAATASGEERTT